MLTKLIAFSKIPEFIKEVHNLKKFLNHHESPERKMPFSTRIRNHLRLNLIQGHYCENNRCLVIFGQGSIWKHEKWH